MRKRIIDPRFFVDSKIGCLTILTRLLFIGLWTYADDEGYYEEDFVQIKAVLFPYNKINVAKKIIPLIENHLIEVYDLNGKLYHHITNFLNYQKISHPTKSKIKPLLRSAKLIESNPELSGKLQSPPENVPQYNIIKYNLKEYNINSRGEQELLFSFLWEKYPNKDGRKLAFKHFVASIKSQKDWDDINIALINYKRMLEIETWRNPKNGSTWFNNWRDWINYVEPKKKSSKLKPEDL